MKKKTLKDLSIILSILESDMQDLNDNKLDMMNITLDERQRMYDAMVIVMEKIETIKKCKICNLHEHVEIELLERNSGGM